MTTGEPMETPAAGLRLARLGLAAGMISRLAGRLVGIVLVVVLARQADPSTVAVYGYLLGTATLVLTFTDLGVASVAGREVAAGRLPAAGALYAALWPQLASVVAAALVTVALTVGFGPDTVPPAALGLTVAFVLVGGMNNLWADVLRGMGRVVLEGTVQLAGAVLLALAGVLVIAGGGSATDLLLVVALKEVAALIVVAAVIRPRRAAVRTRALLGQSVWLAVASTAVVLLWRQGTLVMGGVGSIGALATYVVATRFFDAGVTVAHTFGFGIGPGMSALAADRSAFRSAARKYLGLAAGLGVAVAVVGVLAAGPLTTVPFGARWASAVPAVRFVAVSGLPILIAYVGLTLVVARAQMRWLCFSSVIGMLAGVASTVLLVAHHPNAASAAAGTAIGAVTMAVLLLVGLRDLLFPGIEQPRPLSVSEQSLSDFWGRFVDSGSGSVAFLLRHPLETAAALLAIARLPRREAVLGDTVDGRALHLALDRPGPFGTPLGATGVAVLDVPADPEEYSLGASRQTLRRKARKASKSGVTWRPVDDPAERRALLRLANECEQAHADEQYRIEAPDNTDLLDHDLWLAAFAADGTPLLLSVTPTDGEWAQLRYFRTLGAGQEHSDTRYLMTQVLVETLSPLGVRHLADGVHPTELPNGLRHFQRMVGFRLARVRARLEAADAVPVKDATPSAGRHLTAVR
jgi:O-antigen/teichoic acid export membrane protein